MKVLLNCINHNCIEGAVEKIELHNKINGEVIKVESEGMLDKIEITRDMELTFRLTSSNISKKTYVDKKDGVKKYRTFFTPVKVIVQQKTKIDIIKEWIKPFVYVIVYGNLRKGEDSRECCDKCNKPNKIGGYILVANHIDQRSDYMDLNLDSK